MLSDMGAEVLRIDRAGSVPAGSPPPSPPPPSPSPPPPPPPSPPPSPAPPPAPAASDVLGRGRRSVAVDLKHPAGAGVVLRLVENADALIEGFRPGVTERLGVGPEPCLARNAKLVYGRMTGWGQEGPYASMAGHDINYIALSGVLSLVGRAGEAPVPPVNLVGDFGGGGMLLAFGVVCGLLEASRSGRGQVIDAAMVDGAALLGSMIWGLRAAGEWGERGTNLLDTGSWYYEVYETSDGHHLSVGALEPQFFQLLVEITGVADDGQGPIPDQADRDAWPGMKRRLAAVFRSRTLSQWCERFEGTDACVAPVLDLSEAPAHPHLAKRGTFVEVAGVTQPAPAPRFERTPGSVAFPPPAPGQHTDEALLEWGFGAEEVAQLRRDGALR